MSCRAPLAAIALSVAAMACNSDSDPSPAHRGTAGAAGAPSTGGAPSPSAGGHCHYGDEIRCGDDGDGVGSGDAPEHQLRNPAANECASGSCQSPATPGIPGNLHEYR